jgi:hypothetical protein
MVRNTGESLEDFAKRSLDGERGILRFRQREAKRRTEKVVFKVLIFKEQLVYA